VVKNGDRRRDQRLMLAGWRVVRFTWQQAVDEAAIIGATIHALLRPTSTASPKGAEGTR
jgi:very-short-patch-repair endonuclease